MPDMSVVLCARIVTKLRAVWPKTYIIFRADSGFCRDELLSWIEFEKCYLYEHLYCARGEMENRIKEQQLDLFGDRASCHTFRGNQIRLWFCMAAHLLIVTVRSIGLPCGSAYRSRGVPDSSDGRDRTSARTTNTQWRQDGPRDRIDPGPWRTWRHNHLPRRLRRGTAEIGITGATTSASQEARSSISGPPSFDAKSIIPAP